MKFDDIVAELGEFGPYQKRMFFFACLVGIPAAIQTLMGVFSLGVPDHRCAIPGLTNDTYESQGAWHSHMINASIPRDGDGDFRECDLISGSCDRFVYSQDPFERTIVSDVDLVCGDKQLRTYANMILMGGLLAGSLVLGGLADVIGRKKVLLIGILGHFVCSLVTAFAESYEVFVVLRFCTTFFGMGMFLSAFVIGMEIVGPSKRRYAGIVIEMFWCIGLFIQTGAAYGLRDWTHLQLALSAPTALLLSFWWLMPESPRWLINKGRYEEASKILKEAARVNKVTLNEKMLDLSEMEKDGEGENIWQMFKSKVLVIRSLVIFFNWLVASMVYYGLGLNVGSLSGDIYLNFFLSAVVELAAYVFCLMTLDRLGRKPLQCFSMMFAGVTCLGTMFPVIFGGPEWITQVLSLAGKFGASAGFAVIYVYSAELFPTVMRNSGMGLSSFFARIGGVSAPYIADLGDMIEGDFGIALPLIIFGGLSVIAGFLALLLPETLNRKLPETVEDANNFDTEKTSKSYALDNFVEKKNGGKYNDGFNHDEKC